MVLDFERKVVLDFIEESISYYVDVKPLRNML